MFLYHALSAGEPPIPSPGRHPPPPPSSRKRMLLWRRGDWPRVGSPDALWVRGFHEARPEVVCGICTSDEPTVSMTKRHFIRFAQLIAQQPLDKRASIAALVAVV